MAMRSGSGEVPYGVQAMLGGPYLYIGQPERAVDWCRTQLARGPDTHVFTRAALVLTLRLAGCADDAMAAAKGLIEAAEATRNPHAPLVRASRLRHGLQRRRSRPRAYALRRGLMIAQDSGNRGDESRIAGTPVPSRGHTRRSAALDHLTEAR